MGESYLTNEWVEIKGRCYTVDTHYYDHNKKWFQQLVGALYVDNFYLTHLLEINEFETYIS